MPYIWDVIICTLTTTTTMEWNRSKIQIFPLNNTTQDELPLQISLAPDGDNESIEFGNANSDAYGNTADVV